MTLSNARSVDPGVSSVPISRAASMNRRESIRSLGMDKCKSFRSVQSGICPRVGEFFGGGIERKTHTGGLVSTTIASENCDSRVRATQIAHDHVSPDGVDVCRTRGGDRPCARLVNPIGPNVSKTVQQHV
jgi:hypothetical protein